MKIKRNIIIIFFIYLSCIITGAIIFITASADVTPNWTYEHPKTCYTDPYEYNEAFLAYSDAYHEYIRENDFSIEDEKELSAQFREVWAVVEENSPKGINDLPLTYEKAVDILEFEIQEIYDFAKETGSELSDFNKMELYLLRQRLKWIKEDAARADLESAFVAAEQIYFRGEESSIPRPNYSQLAIEQYEDPGELPEDFANTVAQYEIWYKELKKIEKNSEFDEYTNGLTYEFGISYTLKIFDLLDVQKAEGTINPDVSTAVYNAAKQVTSP